MEWITWLNTGVGIIGIVVGIIGWRSLSKATKIKNNAKADNGASIYQAQVINQGISENTVRLITKDMTREQLCELIIRLIPVNTDDENCIANKFRNGEITEKCFEDLIQEIPTLYYGSKKPLGFPCMKNGDIFIETE